MASKQPNIKLLVKLGVSAGLLFVILRNIQLDELKAIVRLLSIESFVLVCFLYLLSQVVSAIKWRQLIGGVEISRTFGETVRAYIFGMFINVFGLGTVGGDVGRALALKPEKGERAAIFATVVADRIQGLGVLLAIGCTAIAFLRPSHFPDYALYLAYALLAGIILFWWTGPRVIVFFFGRFPKMNNIALQISRAFPRQRQLLASTTILSAITHFLQIFAFYVVAQELEAPASFAYLLAVIPLVNTLATLPVSIQGIGVRESTLILLLAPTGVSEAACVAMGAVWLFASTAVSAICGALIVPDLIRSGEKLLDTAPSEAQILDLEEARSSKRASRL